MSKPSHRRILGALRATGAMTKTQLAGELGLTRQAVNLVVGEMLEDGLLREGGRLSGGVGRAATRYSIDPAGAFAIGLVAEAGRTEAVLVDFLGASHYRTTLAQGQAAGRPDRAALDGVAATIANFCREAGIDVRRISGVGAVIDDAAQAGGGRDLAVAVSDAFGFPVYGGRRANLALLAELTAMTGDWPDSLIYLSIAQGLDAALFMGGGIRTGETGRAMNIGPIEVCAKGATDARQLGEIAALACLESRLGAPMAEFYQARLDRPGVAEAWMAEAADALGQWAAMLHLSLDLSGVCVHVDLPGATARQFVEQLRGAVSGRLGGSGPAVTQSGLGAEAAVLGAAALPLNYAHIHQDILPGARQWSPGAARI